MHSLLPLLKGGRPRMVCQENKYFIFWQNESCPTNQLKVDQYKYTLHFHTKLDWE